MGEKKGRWGEGGLGDGVPGLRREMFDPKMAILVKALERTSNFRNVGKQIPCAI